MLEVWQAIGDEAACWWNRSLCLARLNARNMERAVWRRRTAVVCDDWDDAHGDGCIPAGRDWSALIIHSRSPRPVVGDTGWGCGLSWNRRELLCISECTGLGSQVAEWESVDTGWHLHVSGQIMANQRTKRRVWQCPSCEKRYKIRATAKDPERCPKCKDLGSTNVVPAIASEGEEPAGTEATLLIAGRRFSRQSAVAVRQY